MANENKQLSVIWTELKQKGRQRKIFPLKGMMTTRIHTGKLFFVFFCPCCCFDLFCFCMKTMGDMIRNFSTSIRFIEQRLAKPTQM